TPILGTDLGQFVGRSINDIHRDIIDIAQGDVGVRAIFNPTPLPDLATSPAPFQDTADQTTFLTQFILDSSHLGQMATTIAIDLASNNLPAGGGTYDDVVAAAEATAVTTTTATTPAPNSTSAPVADLTAPAQSTTPATAGGAELAATASADAGHHAPIDPTGLHDQHSPAAEMAQHFHHLWG